MTHVLRKSIGPWSAGTRVRIVEHDGHIASVTTERHMPIEVEHVKLYDDESQTKTYVRKKDHVSFEVAIEDLVELRPNAHANRTENNRRARRAKNPLVIAKRMSRQSPPEMVD